jgi:transcriptional regulator with XRE-family HTH domain
MARRGRPKRETVSIDIDWVKTRMKALNLRSFADLARSIGMDKGMLSKSLLGQRVLTTKDVAGLADALKVSADEIMRRFGQEIEHIGVMITGKITADGKVSTVASRKGEVFVAPESPGHTEALVIEGLVGYDNATVIYRPVKPGGQVPLNMIETLCIIEADDHLNPFFGTLVKGAGKRIAIQLFGSDKRIDVEKVHVASPVLAIHFA